MLFTYRYAARKETICDALKLREVLLRCSLALQIVCQEVIKHTEGECGFNLLIT